MVYFFLTNAVVILPKSGWIWEGNHPEFGSILNDHWNHCKHKERHNLWENPLSSPFLGLGFHQTFQVVLSPRGNAIGFRTKLPESEMVAPKYRGVIRKMSLKTWELKHVPSLGCPGLSKSASPGVLSPQVRLLFSFSLVALQPKTAGCDITNSNWIQPTICTLW